MSGGLVDKLKMDLNSRSIGVIDNILNTIGYEESRETADRRFTTGTNRGNAESQVRDSENVEERGTEEGEKEREVREEVANLSNTLHSPVEIISNIEEIPNKSVRERIEKGRKVKGWYDVMTGKVYIYLPNTDSAYDAQVTMFHELVAHKGLKQMFGKEYGGLSLYIT